MPLRNLIIVCLTPLIALSCVFAQGGIGSIVGQIRLTRSDFPGRVFVELQLRGAAIASTYSDDQGKFGFYGLGSNPYHVIIQDERFSPVDQLVVVDATISPLSIAQISLSTREATKREPSQRQEGSNPYIVDPSEYRRHFPKSAVKEFDKGVENDRIGKKDEAMRHYAKAVEISPDFYPAHNNLGSAYLSRSDFANARKEFEQVILLNQSDATAYCNLSNVCMMTGQLADAQHYLDEGMRREPDSALGHFLLGSLDIKIGRFQQAEAALRQTIQLSPTMAQARLQLMNLMLQQGRNADAVSELQQFVTTFPDSPYASKARELLHRLETPASASARSK